MLVTLVNLIVAGLLIYLIMLCRYYDKTIHTLVEEVTKFTRDVEKLRTTYIYMEKELDYLKAQTAYKKFGGNAEIFIGEKDVR